DVATLDAGSEERKAQRISPTGYANTICCATKCSEVGLELLDHRSATEPAILQGRPEDMQQLFLEFLVWRHQVNKRNHARLFHHCSLSVTLITGRLSRASSVTYRPLPAAAQPADQPRHRSPAFCCAGCSR